MVIEQFEEGSEEGIDDRDKRIIEIMMQDSKTPFTKIGKELGISEAAVRRRIRKLEMMGVIRKFTVVVDPSKIGYKHVAIIGIDSEPDKLIQIAHDLASKDFSKKVYITTGDHMIMMEAWARDSMEMTKILQEIGSINGVRKVCPAIILDYVKQ
ncbi:transcriptional regulator [Thermocladium modestius]|uniref:Transcriptional regulator n=1 Tax=Thermocladium modestius TaxID=62609 RepID=A0A830GWP4_9CREN|nr:Lrp/AsnC family transcriptional regulator [Thermocladium modestius]GGP21855.1 transcriptional regulator [Thermocladium modestius]